MPVHPDIVVQAWTNKRLREEHQLPQADAGQAWPGASVPAIYGGPAAYWATWMDCRSSVPAVRRPLPSLSGGTPTTTRRALAASGGGGLDCRASARLRLGPRNRTDESCVERNLRLMPEGQPFATTSMQHASPTGTSMFVPATPVLPHVFTTAAPHSGRSLAILRTSAAVALIPLLLFGLVIQRLS